MAASLSSSQKATPLARRLLFPHLHNNSPLPPLLASSTNPDLNDELYDFIALALRAFVNSWWTRITRYDKEFLPQISLIITHVARVLELRIQETDFSPLVFSHIPTILTQHYRDYHTGSSKLNTSYIKGGSYSLPDAFHHLQPHMALSPSGEINIEYYRQVFDKVLEVCLPEENFVPEAERYIIREVALKVVLQNIIPKITQPWFINKTILDQLTGGEMDQPLTSPPPRPDTPTNGLTIHAFLVYFFSATHAISAACLALVYGYKQAVSTIKVINTSTLTDSPPPSSPVQGSSSGSKSSSLYSVFEQTIPDDIDYVNPILALVAEVLSTSSRFAASTVIYTLALVAAMFAPFLNKLLPYLLTQTLSSRLMIMILRISKRNLFPPSNNGYPLPAPPDPTPEEQQLFIKQLVSHKLSGTCGLVAALMLGTDAEKTVSAAIAPLQSQECNAHLVVFLLDAILATLIPELCEDLN